MTMKRPNLSLSTVTTRPQAGLRDHLRNSTAAAGLRRLAVATGFVLVGVPVALANPQGGTVVAGKATIDQKSSTVTQITQTTDRAVIDWRSFSIDQGQTTIFQQPSSSSTTLNRVTGPDPSVIAGKLQANGNLILINQSGIVFSQGSQVDVNGIVATPSDISNKNFMAGNLNFDTPSSKPGAKVVNEGTITVAEKGLAALVAPGTSNSGVINAKLGRVVIGGAETFTVDFNGDGLISFDVTSKVKAAQLGADGKANPLVSNTGKINAQGGRVLLTAEAADGILTDVVSMGGEVNAKTQGAVTGSVVVDAGATGKVTQTGKIDVSGLNAGETGGSAVVTGKSVTIADGAKIDARSDAGGGTIKVGGGYQGKDATVRNAKITYVAGGALLDASASSRGKGGAVTIWSDEATGFFGKIASTGGRLGGDGGLAEVSSKGYLSFNGSADLTAANGATGTLLLDPGAITIGGATPGPDLFAGQILNATVDSSIPVATLQTQFQSANVSILAADSVTFASSIDLTPAANGVAGDRTFTISAGKFIVNNGVVITSSNRKVNWSVTTTSNTGGLDINGSIDTNGGNFSAVANISGTGGLIEVRGPINAGTGAVSISLKGESLAVGGTTGATYALDAVEFANITAASKTFISDTGLAIGTKTQASLATTGALSFQTTGGGIVVDNSVKASTTLSLASAAGVTINSANTLEATAGAVTISAANALALGAGATAGDAPTTLKAGTAVNLAGVTGAITGAANAPVTIDAGTGFTMPKDITTGGATIINAHAGNFSTGGNKLSAGTNNITIGAADISLAGTITGGVLALNATGAVTDGAGAGLVTATTVKGTSTGGASLTNANNAIGLIDGFKNTGSGGVTVATKTDLRTNGIIDAGTGSLKLTTATGKNLTLGNDNGSTTLSAGTKIDLAGIAGTISGGTGAAVTINSGTGFALLKALTTSGSTAINAGSGAYDDGGFQLTTTNKALSITATDITLSVAGALDSGTAQTTLTATSGATMGVGTATGTFTVDSAELGRISAGSLALKTLGATGDMTVTGATFAKSTTLSSGHDLAISGATTLNEGLTASAANKLTVSTDLAAAGNLSLTGGTAGLTLTGDRILTAAAGADGGKITLDGGTGGTSTTGSLTLNANNGVTIAGDLSGQVVTVNADNNASGTGTFTVTSGSTTNGSSINVTAADLDLQGNLTSTGKVLLTASSTQTIGLGTAGGDFSVSDAELGRISATGSIIVSSSQTISTDNVTAASTASDLELVGAKGISFGSGGSSFGGGLNAKATTGGIAVDGSVSAAKGLSLAANDAATGKIAFADGVAVRAGTASTGGALTLSAGKAITAAGALTLGSDADFTLPLDLTTAGTTVIDTGAGRFLSGGHVLDTSGNALTITASDFVLTGAAALSSGAAKTTLSATAGRTMGVGTATGDATLDNGELGRISAGSLALTTSGATGDMTVTTASFTPGVTLSSGHDLTISGTPTFGGALDASASNKLAVGADLTTTGDLSLSGGSGGLAFGGGGRTLVAKLGTIALDGGAAGISAPGGLTLVADADVSIKSSLTGGAVAATANKDGLNGGVIRLGDGAGAVTIDTGVTTQTYSSAVELAADIALKGTGVFFGATLDSDSNATQRGVTITDKGTTTFNAKVGGIAKLASLDVDSNAIVVNQAVTANSTVTVVSKGAFVSNGGITADLLTGSTVGGATFGGTNFVNKLGTFTNSGGGGITLATANALTTTGTIDAGTGTLSLTTTNSGGLTIGSSLTAGASVSLNSSGAIRGNGGTISATTLTGSASGGAGFGGANQIGTLSGFTNTGSGGLTLNNTKALATTGAVNAGTGSLNLTTTVGGMTVSGSLNAGAAVNLISAGTINAASGVINAASLTGSSSGGATFTAANSIGTLGGFTNTGAGGLSVVNTQALATTGTVDGGTGSLNLSTTAGSMTLGGTLKSTTEVKVSSAAGLTSSAGINAGTGSVTLTTAAGDMILGGSITGTSSVSLVSSATIDQSTGALTTNALSGSSAGGATFTGTNKIATFGSFTNTGAGGIAVTNGQALATAGTIDAGSGPLTLKTTAGGMTLAGALKSTSTISANSANGLDNTAGIDAGGGSVTLTTGAGGAMVLGGSVVGTTSIALVSGGSIDESAGALTTNSLTGSSSGAATLTGTNKIGTFGAFTNAAGGGIVFVNGQALKTAGTVDAGTGPLDLTTTTGGMTLAGQLKSATDVKLASAGRIDAAGAAISAGTLSGSSAGGATFTGANLINTFGAFANTGSGGITLSNAKALNTTGAISAGADGLVLQTTGGGMTLAGTLASDSSVVLNADGAINGSAAKITTPKLSGSSVGGALLTGANLFGLLGPFTNTSGGALAFVTGQALNTTGTIDAGGGTLALTTTTGGMKFGGALQNATSIALNAAGVVDASTTTIQTGNLSGSSNGGATFTGPNNAIDTFGSFVNAGAGGIVLVNSRTLGTTGTVDAGTGALALTTTSGGIAIGGPLKSTTSIVVQSAAGISTAGNIDAGTGLLVLNAANGGITLGGALKSDISIALTSTGSINASQSIDAGSGKVELKATDGAIGIGGPISAGTSVTLTAGNGPIIESSGTITTGLLTGTSIGGISLGGANRIATVGNLISKNGAGGANTGVELRNAIDLLIGAQIDAGAGPLTVASAAGLKLTGAQLNGSEIFLTAKGPVAIGGGSFTAAKQVIVSTAPGSITQVGFTSFSTPILVLDTTLATPSALRALGPTPANSLPGFLPGSGKGDIDVAALLAPQTTLYFVVGSGAIKANGINVAQLGVSGSGGSAAIVGTVGGISGPAAAQLSVKDGPRDNNYKLNDCAIGNPTCIVLPTIAPLQPQISRDVYIVEPTRQFNDPTLQRLNFGNEDYF